MTEFTRATRDSDDKSEAVKRGNRTKLKAGYIPAGRLPEGYMHQRNDQWQMINVPDPERFPKLQQAIGKILYHHYSPREALDYLNHELDYRTKRTRRGGGTPLSQSTWYRLLSDPLYIGDLSKWGDDENGNPYTGQYETLLTIEEFEKLQIMLGKPGGIRRQRRKEWPYNGVIRCGGCQGAVVMEEKWQRICSKCKHKFAITATRTHCPQCQLPTTRMTTTPLHYVYLHCGKSKHLPDGSKCPQRSVRIENFEQQVDILLDQIEIPKSFAQWVVKWLKILHTQDSREHAQNLTNVQQQYNGVEARLWKLAIMRLDNELDTDEFRIVKHTLLREKRKLEEKIRRLETYTDDWIAKVEQLLDFAASARKWFATGTHEQKRFVLKSLGSNLTLQDKKLRIEALKPFVVLKEMKRTDDYEKIMFELEKTPEVSVDSATPLTEFPKLLAGWDAIRTQILCGDWDSHPFISGISN